MSLSVNDIIKAPIASEKASLLTEKSNYYSFFVNKKATKSQIKKSIQDFFSVDVVWVRTSIIPGRLKRVGRELTRVSAKKKAYVKLKEGHSIDLTKNI